MIKKMSKAKMIQRLENLQSKMQYKTSIPIVLDLEKWINSNNQSSSFGKYVLNIEKKNPNAVIIIDDMLLETDMYLPTEIILSEGKETIKRFIDLALNHSEVDYMKAYIELFNEQFGIDEPDCSWKYPGSTRRFDGERWSTDEEEKQRCFNLERKKHADSIEVTRNVLKESPVILDFFDHYKKLTVEEMVERYKDQRFFRKECEQN